jgi:hypothetical protein
VWCDGARAAGVLLLAPPDFTGRMGEALRPGGVNLKARRRGAREGGRAGVGRAREVGGGVTDGRITCRNGKHDLLSRVSPAENPKMTRFRGRANSNSNCTM